MKTKAYGFIINNHLVLKCMSFDEGTALRAAHQSNYERNVNNNIIDDIKLVAIDIEYSIVKQISLSKKRKKLKKRRKLLKRRSKH